MENNYQAFLLRLQRTESKECWRSTLQNVQTGEIFHFATEHEMVTHLLDSLAPTREERPLNVKSDNSNQRA